MEHLIRASVFAPEHIGRAHAASARIHDADEAGEQFLPPRVRAGEHRDKPRHQWGEAAALQQQGHLRAL
eukprot:6996820-Karenia_brevis.AAC.1